MNNRLIIQLIAISSMIMASWGFAKAHDYEKTISKGDLVWNNNLDADFFNGAFIGDGTQGAMITQDPNNKNGIRMMLGHYMAIAHNYIQHVDMCDSRVFIGDIVITPSGKSQGQTMRLDLFNGEARGTIVTDKGQIDWTAIADRKNNAFVVKLEVSGGETAASVQFKEQWAVSTAFYQGGKDPNNYVNQVATKPVKTTDGDIGLVTSKMNKRGALSIASRLEVSGNTKTLYVTIGTDASTNLNTAATNAINQAKTKISSAFSEGEAAIFARNRNWWNQYMKSSYLEIEQDPYWQKFWWLQIYKFGCSSSETAGLLIDTQGPWTTQCGWAAIWWNLNIQLSYYPMFSANKLDAGRSLIDGMDRMYQTGAFHQNAKDVGKSGMYVGRTTNFLGKGNWGDELGNMPWILHSYWNYWKYSAEDSIGKALFPMMKDNAVFMISKLEKGTDGTYHMAASRSPEYDDSKLYRDANYALMSLDWELRTLIEMDSVLGFNDPEKAKWEEVLENLPGFPANENGFMISPDQGFDKGHRHYSHLLAIYPYHTINPDMGGNDVIKRSVDRWYDLSVVSGAAGYTFTGSCAMYATLRDGNKALTALDKLKSHLKPNTMYAEGTNPVIETPLSGVESINYMMLQSWGGVIRVFPAVPDSWTDVSFKGFRTVGAFLVSAARKNGEFTSFTITSEKGLDCLVENPWKGKKLIVKDQLGNRLATVEKNGNVSFETKAGETYSLSAVNIPVLLEGYVIDHPRKIYVKTSELLVDSVPFAGFTVQVNAVEANIDSVSFASGSNILVLEMADSIDKDDYITASYANGNVYSIDSLQLKAFDNTIIENLLPGSSPRITKAQTDELGTLVEVRFSKPMLVSSMSPVLIKLYEGGNALSIDSAAQDLSDSLKWSLYVKEKLYNVYQLKLAYNDVALKSADGGILKAFESIPVTNLSPGRAPELKIGRVIENGMGIELIFDKTIMDASSQAAFFSVNVNGRFARLDNIVTSGKTVTLSLKDPVRYNEKVSLTFAGGEIHSSDGGVLSSVSAYEILVNMAEPVYQAVPGKIQAESYFVQYGLQAEGTSDTGGGQNIGYIGPGDWGDYAVNVSDTGTYEAEFRVAGTGSGKIILQKADGDVFTDLCNISYAPTGSWQTWVSVKTKLKIENQGHQVFRLYFPNSGVNVNWVDFKLDTVEVVTNLLPVGGFDDVKVYPNPSEGTVHIESNGFRYTSVSVYDIEGKKMLENTGPFEARKSFPLALNRGLYVMVLSNNTEKRLFNLAIR
jgi:alpha-L-fucosidase 2